MNNVCTHTELIDYSTFIFACSDNVKFRGRNSLLHLFNADATHDSVFECPVQRDFIVRGELSVLYAT